MQVDKWVEQCSNLHLYIEYCTNSIRTLIVRR